MNEKEATANHVQVDDSSYHIENNFPSADESNTRSDSESLGTIRELNKVYANRLKECNDTEKASEEKLTILQDWVDSLIEQNIMLIDVVETFEKEAVFQLKVGFESQKLQNKEFQVLQQQMTCKNRIIEAQQKALQKLHSPIRNEADEETNKNVERSSVNDECNSIERGETRTSKSMESSNNDITSQSCSEKLLETIKKQLQNAENEKEKLKKNVVDVEKKMDKLNQLMISNEKNAREMRAALTAEVAEKHDQVLALRREAQHLEDRLRQADMQTHFKDDIIKELRKEIKVANNKLVGQLRDKDAAVCNLEEKLKILKGLPIELSSQLHHLKHRVSNLNELLAAKHRNEPKNDMQLVLNSILFNLNEALILVDGYKSTSDGNASLLKPDDRQRKSSSNICDLSQNQISMTKLMNELQSVKKLLHDDKQGSIKSKNEDNRTVLCSACNNNRTEDQEIIETLKFAIEPLEEYFSKRLHNQNDKQNLPMKNLLESARCTRSLLEKINFKGKHPPTTSLPDNTSKGQKDCKDVSSSVEMKNIQSENCRDDTIKKLTNDLYELNCQLQSREKIITNQQETIDLLQNSLQMEQTEMESLKVEKERADAETRALQAKVLMLEAELKNVQDSLGNSPTLAGGKVNPPTSKTWAPWSGKQALPTHRHIHDV